MNLDEAIRRLRTREPQWKFDARDRAALGLVLDALERAESTVARLRKALEDAVDGGNAGEWLAAHDIARAALEEE